MDARETHGEDQSSSTLPEKIKNQFECVPPWPEVQLCKTKSKVGDVLLFDCQRTAEQHATAGIHSAHWGIMITHHSNYRKSEGGNSENMRKLKYEASPSMATTACPLERAGPESVPWCVRPPAASRRCGYYGHLPCCIMMNHAASCCSAYVPLIAWDPTSSVEKDSKALRGINICARFTVQSTPWTECVCVWE